MKLPRMIRVIRGNAKLASLLSLAGEAPAI